MLKRIISCLVLAVLTTACAGAGMQRRGGLAERQDPIFLELIIIGGILGAGDSGDSDPVEDDSDSGLGTAMMAVGAVALVGGLVWLLSESGDVDEPTPKTRRRYKHESNVGDHPEFIQAALR